MSRALPPSRRENTLFIVITRRGRYDRRTPYHCRRTVCAVYLEFGHDARSTGSAGRRDSRAYCVSRTVVDVRRTPLYAVGTTRGTRSADDSSTHVQRKSNVFRSRTDRIGSGKRPQIPLGNTRKVRAPLVRDREEAVGAPRDSPPRPSRRHRFRRDQPYRVARTKRPFKPGRDDGGETVEEDP